jgi:hypothetical protein
MNPYGCISTENRVGLIEVVLNAETIANIQKEKGTFSATSAFRKGSILGKQSNLDFTYFRNVFFVNFDLIEFGWNVKPLNTSLPTLPRFE